MAVDIQPWGPSSYLRTDVEAVNLVIDSRASLCSHGFRHKLLPPYTEAGPAAGVPCQ